jgi:hypothetical protein
MIRAFRRHISIQSQFRDIFEALSYTFADFSIPQFQNIHALRAIEYASRFQPHVTIEHACASRIPRVEPISASPTIHSLDSPIENLCCRIKRHIRPILCVAVMVGRGAKVGSSTAAPINQRTSSANPNNLRNNTLRITRESCSLHIRIIHKLRQCPRDTRRRSRHPLRRGRGIKGEVAPWSLG